MIDGHGFGIKFNEAPKITRSMKVALDDLALERLRVVYPGSEICPVDHKITVLPLSRIEETFSGK
jgi:predicted AAA+ superfamily ATPase